MSIDLTVQENEKWFQYPKEIQVILDKIKTDTSWNVRDVLLQEDFSSIFLYLWENYTGYWVIPGEIQKLLNNRAFVNYINTYIKQNINNILNNDGIYSFEEISFCFFLLSFWKFNGVLVDLNTYNLETLSHLLNHIIEHILDSRNSQETQEMYYESFLNVTDLVNTLCILNEIDSSRKVLIPKFTQLLTEKVINLEKKLKNQNRITPEKQDQLAYLMARFWINFSHISYISIQDKLLGEIIDWFKEIIDKQIKSYNEALRTQFWWKPDKIHVMQGVFFWNVAYTLLVMITKIKEWHLKNHIEMDEKSIFDNVIFQDLVSSALFHLTGTNQDSEQFSLHFLEKVCNNIFANIYFHKKSERVTEDWYAKTAIVDFISNNNTTKTGGAQIESIHHLIMFLPELDELELLEFWNFLLWLPKYNNYNFEFFKLKTFDLIVSKLHSIEYFNNATPEILNLNKEIKNFLEKLTYYIEKNKTASQLLHTYSRLYLSIAYFYSFCFWEECQNLSLEHFSIFSKMNGDAFEYEKYGKSLEEYYYRIGAYKLSNTLCNCENIGNCGVIQKCNFTREQVMKFGEKKVMDYKKAHEPILRNIIDDLLQRLLDDALSQNGLSDDEINKKISEILSNKVFHGIANTFIFEFHQNEHSKDEDIKNIVKKKLKLHNGIECHIVDLFNGYKLVFSYPKIYEPTFKELFAQENNYIIINIKNIITWYLKKRDSFLDHGTGLPNEAKLKTMLVNNKTPISFINLKLSTIKSINNGYSYDIWDEYMKNVWVALSQIPELKGNIFRLSGAKFWMIISDKEKIEHIIEQIKGIKIRAGEVEFKLDFFIGIVLNETQRIVEKSSSALAFARKKWKQSAFYTDEINDLSQDKKDLEYLTKLDKAIEEDRIVPFFQPIKCTKTWKILKYEALMRVRNEDWEFESPSLYLDAAKKFGRLNKLANIMIEKVFLYAFQNKGNFSINLSGDDLWNDEILTFISNQLKKCIIDPQRITFEILEWEWTEDNQNISWVIKLKDMWFRIAMDDFWANNSNINRLIDFLSSGIIDDLKIDGKMIRSLDRDDTALKEELELLFQLLMKRLEQKGSNNTKTYEVLWEWDKEINRMINALVSQYLYLKKHIDYLVDEVNSLDEFNKKTQEIFELINTERNKFSSATKKMLDGIVGASHDSWVKVIAEFVESEKIKLICEVLWIDGLQWYYIWKPWQYSK